MRSLVCNIEPQPVVAPALHPVLEAAPIRTRDLEDLPVLRSMTFDFAS